MDFSQAIPTFVITLREGVEAALVVGIVLACLSKANRSELNRWVYGGVAAGIVGKRADWPIFRPDSEPGAVCRARFEVCR